MRFNRKSCDQEKKIKREKQVAPKRNDVKVRPGDVVRVNGKIGIAIYETYHLGKRFLVRCADGSDMTIKLTIPDPKFEDEPRVILIGHDEDWLSFELGAQRRRRTLSDAYLKESYRLFREVTQARREMKSLTPPTEAECDLCRYRGVDGCRLGNDRETCENFIKADPTKEL